MGLKLMLDQKTLGDVEEKINFFDFGFGLRWYYVMLHWCVKFAIYSRKIKPEIEEATLGYYGKWECVREVLVLHLRPKLAFFINFCDLFLLFSNFANVFLGQNGGHFHN